MCWCKFRRQVPEGSGGFRRVPARVGVGSGGRVRKVPEAGFRRVPARVGVGSGGRVRKVPESSGGVCCLATLTGAAM